MSGADFSRNISGCARKLLPLRIRAIMTSSTFMNPKKNRHTCTDVLVFLYTSEFVMPAKHLKVEECECPWLQKVQNSRLKSKVIPLAVSINDIDKKYLHVERSKY